MIGEFGRAFQVIRASNTALARIAVVGALVAALGLAGCGRKTGLDAPPAAAIPQQTAGAQPGTEPGVDPDKPVAAPGRRKSFFLDWLID
jgi:predicted small lipoprotein YifL